MNVAETYIADVIAGRVVTCQWVKLACQRHVNDLIDGDERGLEFDQESAERMLKFFSILKHSKGEWAGLPITLEPWQQAMFWILFGWRRANHPRWVVQLPNGRYEDTRGARRFRRAYITVARKNGKSTIGAGVGLFLFSADGEPGAEVYTAATKRDQARITHSEATRMVKASPMLSKRVRIFKDNLHIETMACKMEPLGADADTLDGLNVYGAIIDELHAHKNRDVVDKLDTATGSRRSPLLFEITTAGFDRQSYCWQEDEYSRKVLSGVVQDDSHFAMIYTLDDGDNWEDETTWVKSNPNLGVSKKLTQMREKAKKAAEMPAALNAFLRLELNVWTQSESKWMNMDHWKACGFAVDANGLRGRTCYAGLDLSSTLDITAFVMVFPPQHEGDKWQVLPRFWIPEENLQQRVHMDRAPYDVWLREGFVTATPGNAIDYEWIFAQVERDAEQYDIAEIAFDRWGAARVQQVLADMGMTMVEFGQGFASMSPPMKDFERLVANHELAHGNNPVLTWMADNLVAKQDPAGNIKPDKASSREKIDGIVALLMGLDRALRHQDNGSVYEKRGIISF